MPGDQGSVAEMVPCHYAHANHGCNSCNVQLDRSGERLAAPTHQKKWSFIPGDRLVLKDIVLTPIPTKHRSVVRVVHLLSFPSTDRFYRGRNNLFTPNPHLLWCNLHQSHVNCLSTTTTMTLSLSIYPTSNYMSGPLYPRHSQ